MPFLQFSKEKILMKFCYFLLWSKEAQFNINIYIIFPFLSEIILFWFLPFCVETEGYNTSSLFTKVAFFLLLPLRIRVRLLCCPFLRVYTFLDCLYFELQSKAISLHFCNIYILFLILYNLIKKEMQQAFFFATITLF